MAADPKNIQPAGSSVATLQDEAYQMGYQSGYYDHQGNVRSPSTFTAQMMDKLFACGLPHEHTDFEEYTQMIKCVIDILPRIPNIDAATYRGLNRTFEDIVDEAHSEGLERVTASDMCKMILKLRSLVPRGDFPLIGLTGVSAIITTRQQSEQTVKMPQQKEQSGGFFGFMRRG